MHELPTLTVLALFKSAWFWKWIISRNHKLEKCGVTKTNKFHLWNHKGPFSRPVTFLTLQDHRAKDALILCWQFTDCMAARVINWNRHVMDLVWLLFHLFLLKLHPCYIGNGGLNVKNTHIPAWLTVNTCPPWETALARRIRVLIPIIVLLQGLHSCFKGSHACVTDQFIVAWGCFIPAVVYSFPSYLCLCVSSCTCACMLLWRGSFRFCALVGSPHSRDTRGI